MLYNNMKKFNISAIKKNKRSGMEFLGQQANLYYQQMQDDKVQLSIYFLN